MNKTIYSYQDGEGGNPSRQIPCKTIKSVVQCSKSLTLQCDFDMDQETKPTSIRMYPSYFQQLKVIAECKFNMTLPGFIEAIAARKICILDATRTAILNKCIAKDSPAIPKLKRIATETREKFSFRFTLDCISNLRAVGDSLGIKYTTMFENIAEGKFAVCHYETNILLDNAIIKKF